MKKKRKSAAGLRSPIAEPNGNPIGDALRRIRKASRPKPKFKSPWG